jgi:hypothetical protein
VVGVDKNGVTCGNRIRSRWVGAEILFNLFTFSILIDCVVCRSGCEGVMP